MVQGAEMVGLGVCVASLCAYVCPGYDGVVADKAVSGGSTKSTPQRAHHHHQAWCGVDKGSLVSKPCGSVMAGTLTSLHWQQAVQQQAKKGGTCW